MKSICDRCGAPTYGTLFAKNVLLCPSCYKSFDKDLQAAKSKTGKTNAFFLARKHYRERSGNAEGNYLITEIPAAVGRALRRRCEKTKLSQRDIILAALVEYLGLRGEKIK